MPSRVELTGKLPVYSLGPNVEREHLVTRRSFQHVFGDELVELALRHYPRAVVSWDEAMIKAEVGFASFDELPDPNVFGSPLDKLAGAITSQVCHSFDYNMATLDSVLATKASGGLSTPKSVGYWIRFVAPQRLRNQILAVGRLRKDNPKVVSWLHDVMTEYVSWLHTTQQPADRILEETWSDARTFSFYASRSAPGAKLRLVTVVSPVVNCFCRILARNP